jgi:hypothetical protein
MEQHDDHIWLVVGGKAWAIYAIEHDDVIWSFHLWRGYYPDLEERTLIMINPDWDNYCECAIEMLNTLNN